MNQQNGQQQILKQWNEINKMKEEMAVKKRRMSDEIVEKEHKMMDEIMKGMVKNIEEIALLKKENLALKMKMAKMEASLKAVNFIKYSIKISFGIFKGECHPNW
jgi:hypothetical protein